MTSRGLYFSPQLKVLHCGDFLRSGQHCSLSSLLIDLAQSVGLASDKVIAVVSCNLTCIIPPTFCRTVVSLYCPMVADTRLHLPLQTLCLDIEPTRSKKGDLE